MQKILTALVLLAFTCTNAMAYRIEVNKQQMNLNAGNRYSNNFQLVYIPDDDDDISKIPEELRVQVRARGAGSSFVDLSPGYTVIKLPQGNELREEQELRQYFNVNGNTAAIIASGILTIIPLTVDIDINFSPFGPNSNELEPPNDFAAQTRAEISLVDLNSFEEIEPSDEDQENFKDLKLSSINTSSLVCPVLAKDPEDSSKYSLVDIPQPRIHLEAAVPTGVNPQITDSVTQSLVENDLENSTITITKRSKSKLKRLLSKFQQRKFTLSDTNAIIVETTEDGAKMLSIDALVNEANDLEIRKQGLKALVSNDQARLILSGEKLDAEELDTSKFKKAKINYQIKNKDGKGLFHKSKGTLEVIFSFDNLDPIEASE